MPQKRKAKRIFFPKPWQVPLLSGMQTLLFHNPVKKFAKDENELGKFNEIGLGRNYRLYNTLKTQMVYTL